MAAFLFRKDPNVASPGQKSRPGALSFYGRPMGDNAAVRSVGALFR
jgi:hypothetical protein